MSYRGVVIAESLADPTVLADLVVQKTKVVPVTEWHRTPWLTQWTLHTVEVPDERADAVAERLRHAIDTAHATHWYADFRSATTHYVIFHDRIFCVQRGDPSAYEAAKAHGRTLGIPERQLDFDTYDPDDA
jgi:hypothetical protein